MEVVEQNRPAAIVLSGGPASIYDPGAPQLDPEILQLGVPVLGICYGLQAIAYTLGGKVEPAQEREYGRAALTQISKESVLLRGISVGAQVWMSHGDKVVQLPPNFKPSAGTVDTFAAAIESDDHIISGVQFHPEVVHTHNGSKIIANFLYSIAKLKDDWTMASFIEASIT